MKTPIAFGDDLELEVTIYNYGVAPVPQNSTITLDGGQYFHKGRIIIDKEIPVGGQVTKSTTLFCTKQPFDKIAGIVFVYTNKIQMY